MPGVLQQSEKFAIRESIETYLNRLDAHDWKAVAACFATDARSHYNYEPELLLGGNAVVAWLRARLAPYIATQHALANLHIGVEGDFAHCDSRVTASLLHEIDGERRTTVRVIAYRDRLRREGDQWQIVERHHEPLWQYTVPAQTPRL